MCGRFVVADPAAELVGVLHVDRVSPALPAPSYNVAPTARAAIVLDSARTDPPTRRLEPARWGLVPAWAKDPGAGGRAFNARSEELEDKPTFRAAFRMRRAIVPVTGYYEWTPAAGRTVPRYIRPRDDRPLLLAGLYEWWRDAAKAGDDPDRWLLSFTILTRGSAGGLRPVHDRMPLFLDADLAGPWLDPGTGDARGVLDAAIGAAPAIAKTLEMRTVSAAVGNTRNDSPALIAPDAG
ncbi:MAG: SOS response-associated peptidase [Microbacterium sp.]